MPVYGLTPHHAGMIARAYGVKLPRVDKCFILDLGLQKNFAGQLCADARHYFFLGNAGQWRRVLKRAGLEQIA